MKQKERNSNFELMRIVSMLMIILWHMYIYGGIRDRGVVQNPSLQVIFDFLYCVYMVHVNSFVLLTGYFQFDKKIKPSKIVSIIDMSLFYKIISMIIFVSLGLITVTKLDIIQNMFPFELNLNDSHWFIRYYIFLYLLIPFINILIKNINKKDFKKLLIVLTFVFSIIPFITGNKSMENNGFTLYQFIYIYFIGAFLGKYKINKNDIIKKIPVNLYRIILISIFLLCAVSNYNMNITCNHLRGLNSVYNEIFGNFITMFSRYSNPIVLIQSLSYFLLFETLDFKSKIINKVSTLTLGIYLIHFDFNVRNSIFIFLKIDGGPYHSYKYLLYYFTIGILIFICSGIIEFIRQVIMKFIKKRKITQKFENKISSFVDSLKFKESNVKE